jgi:AAA domain-containing protein
VFLLSPANVGGERAALLFNPSATFPLALRLRSPAGAPLGEVFSFVSGLYFRGKMRYAQAFGRGPEGFPGALVISAGEGLRFLHEPITLPRLRAWAEVEIDEHNPRFTEPLLEHATALHESLGERARFVLLGSVATDKYVGPLRAVFGERLLFPPDFAGRGDMSRGGLLLRATRENRELDYAPVAGARRHGPRPERLSRAPRREPAEPARPELVILVGLPGAGKSTFFRQRYAGSHTHVSKDELKSRRRPEQSQRELIEQALSLGRSLVIDNTNVSHETRAPLIEAARRHGARVIGYYFDCPTQDCVNRNFGRSGRARIPLVGIFAAAKRLARPTRAEGFDALHTVHTLPGERFEISADECLVPAARDELRRDPDP